jgi:hypothetical protein
MKIILLVILGMAVIVAIFLIRRDQKQRQMLIDSMIQRLELDSEEFESLPEEPEIPPRI